MLTLHQKAARIGGLSLFILVIILLLGLFQWFASEPVDTSRLRFTDPEASSDIANGVGNGGAAAQVGVLESTFAEAKGVKHSNDKEQVLDKPLTMYADELSASDGKVLRGLLMDFWSECDAKANCDYLLKLLALLLDKQDYKILASYQHLEAQRKTLMGLELMPQDASLEDKIAQVKYVDAQVWGMAAERLFVDLYQMYDYRLASRELELLVDAQQYVEQYNVLRENAFSANKDASSERVKDPLHAYEQAMDWLPQTMSVEQRDRAQALLAKQYLNQHQAAAISERNKQVEVQALKVRNYQIELARLKKILETQRATSHGKMSNTEWKSYYETQLYEFRVNFFDL